MTTFSDSTQHGVWITPEYSPFIRVGGLGQVSREIPAALNQYDNKDVRVIFPALKGFWEHPEGFSSGDWKLTQVCISFPLPLSPKNTPSKLQKKPAVAKFEVYTATQNNTILYALADPTDIPDEETLFRTCQSLYTDPIVERMMIFNRAVAAVLARLADLDISAPVNLVESPEKTSFKPDFIIVNDWLTAPTPYLLEANDPNYFCGVGKLFMLHNTYDQILTVSDVQEQLGLALPVECNWPYRYPESPQTPCFSWLTYGLSSADKVLVDTHYAETVKDLFEGTPIATALGKPGKVAANIHHGIDDRLDPSHLNPGDDFFPLPQPITDYPHFEASQPAILQYKQQNRAALNAYARCLEESPEVSGTLSPVSYGSGNLFLFLGRLSPEQKGIHLILETLPKLLKESPHNQLIFSTLDDEPDIINLLKDWAKDYPGQMLLLQCRAQLNLLYAGADFFLMPSLYEPFGLTQLEAMKMGTIPIVHHRDGLKTTVTPERGVLMPAMNVTDILAVQSYVAQLMGHRLTSRPGSTPWEKREAILFQTACKQFATTLQTATKLTLDDRLHKMDNGMRYVLQEHQWSRIAHRYEAPIVEAIQQARAILSSV